MIPSHRKSAASLSRRRLMLSASTMFGAGLVPFSHLSAVARQDATTVTFWTPGGSPLFCDTQAEIAADYKAVKPEVTVEFECGSDPNLFLERFLSSITAGNPPDATILWDTPVSLAVQGALRAIDDLMATAEYAGVENWPAGVLASCQLGGQTFGLPVAAGTYGMWFNQELFDAKGISTDPADFPKTWDELRKLSKEFTQWDGDRLVSAGFVLPPVNDWVPTLPIWSALNGGQLYDADNQRYTIDAEPNVALMDYFLSWLDEEYHGDFNQVLRSGAWKPYPSDEGQPPEFQAGHLAMIEWGSWGMGDFYAFGDPAFTEWGLASYPVGPGGETTVSGYWPNWLAIPSGAAEPEAGFGYLDYMSGVGVAKWFAAVPDLPTNAKVPEVVPSLVAEKRGEEFATEAIAFFRDQLQIVTPMWDSPVQSFALDQLNRTVEEILSKTTTPRDALAEAQLACQAELDRVLSEAS